MTPVFEARNLTKRFADKTALDHVSLQIPPASVVGLIGPNGAGKTTLLHHVTGLYLPTEGACSTFGRASGELGGEELSRIGMVQQEGRSLEWMTVRQQLRYVASFYKRWDLGLQRRLTEEFELDEKERVVRLSPGNAQKLSLILAVCHHPDLLLLDEPVSALDPLVRQKLLRFLLELLGEGSALTIVISSHVLRDIERVVDQVVCLSQGRVTTNASLDDLKERYLEWRIVSQQALPERFEEPFILQQQVNRHQARLIVRQEDSAMEAFSRRHGVEVSATPLNLESMYPFLIEEVMP